jgi:acyl-coenzyme A thioesterase PaaI-like protein
MALDLKKDANCFVCGRENPEGLRLHVETDGKDGVKARFVALDRYKGWSDYLHGGIISLLFDELLGWVSQNAGYDAVTARLEIRYRNPVPLYNRLTVQARLEREARGLLDIRMVAHLEDGTVAAEGKGRMMIVSKRPDSLCRE